MPAIAEVVKKQTQIGIDCIGDGEFWTARSLSHYVAHFTGLEARPVRADEPPTSRHSTRERDEFRAAGERTPAHVDALRAMAVGVFCGTGDPFYLATRHLVSLMDFPHLARFGPGGHDPGYWHQVAPAQLRAMARRLSVRIREA